MTTYEHIAIGDSFECGSHRFSAEEIKRFAKLYDQQVFHTDEVAAKETLLGALCASGWHTAAIMMKLFVKRLADENEKVKARGKAAPALGPSLGVDDLRWLKPVFVDDEIAFSAQIVGKRESESRPGWGIVSIKSSGLNQKGEPVFACTGHIFVAKIETD